MHFFLWIFSAEPFSDVAIHLLNGILLRICLKKTESVFLVWNSKSIICIIQLPKSCNCQNTYLKFNDKLGNHQEKLSFCPQRTHYPCTSQWYGNHRSSFTLVEVTFMIITIFHLLDHWQSFKYYNKAGYEWSRSPYIENLLIKQFDDSLTCLFTTNAVFISND